MSNITNRHCYTCNTCASTTEKINTGTFEFSITPEDSNELASIRCQRYQWRQVVLPNCLASQSVVKYYLLLESRWAAHWWNLYAWISVTCICFIAMIFSIQSFMSNFIINLSIAQPTCFPLIVVITWPRCNVAVAIVWS